ncbi:phosphoribosyltransferase family protein [Metabacillus lacus]|nr:phosphoribosyltransferase family protein [Metabacillus lacus]
MSARVNKKRGFLFVSKVLGKHLPVHPLKPLLTSGLLAITYYEHTTGESVKGKEAIIKGAFSDCPHEMREAYNLLTTLHLDLKESPVIIGFAETATSLGHSFFERFEHAFYYHTTRELVEDETPCLSFEEEHSHAVDQLCYIHEERINHDKPIILVDDEITTGNTALNIIRNIHSKYPRKHYSVVSILDWRSEENREQFLQLEKELNIQITIVSLLSGRMEFIGRTIEDAAYNYQPLDHAGTEEHINYVSLHEYFIESHYVCSNKSIPYIEGTGRFGISKSSQLHIEDACMKAGQYLRQMREGHQTLCLGTGEFMYIPMRIASHLGEGVYFHSTTRSPILPVNQPDYGIQNGFSFSNPENMSIVHYLYNIPKDVYDDVFIFFEKEIPESSLKELKDIMKERGILSINIVVFSKNNRGVIV